VEITLCSIYFIDANMPTRWPYLGENLVVINACWRQICEINEK